MFFQSGGGQHVAGVVDVVFCVLFWSVLILMGLYVREIGFSD